MSRYESGEAFAVSGGRGVGLIAGDTAPEVVERVWHALEDGDGVGDVLTVLVEQCGLASLPDFAVSVVEPDGSARIIVRGVFSARTATGEIVASDSPTFWTERRVPDAGAVVLASVDAAPSVVVSGLSLRSGVVRAASISTEDDIEGPGALPPADTDAAERRVRSHLPEPGRVPEPQPGRVPEPEPLPDREPGPGPELEPQPDREPEPGPGPVPEPLPDRESGAGPEPEPQPERQPVPEPHVPQEPGDAWPAETVPPPGTTEETRVPSDDTFGTPSVHAAGGLSVEEGTTTYDDLIFGMTRMATVEDAAVRETDATPEAPLGGSMIGTIPPVPPSAPESSASGSASARGDHDGLTISAEQLAALRLGGGTPAPLGAPATVAHVVLVASTGERTVLDRGAVVGVRPSAVRETGVVPHLIAVPSPAGEISRRHLEIRVEGPDILAVDLNSTNGTRLLRVGADPVRLHPGAPTLLVAGDRLDLGDGVLFSFEGLR